MKTTQLENGWTQIDYVKSDIFKFNHNGWNCKVLPSYPNEYGDIWDWYIWPIGTEENYGNDWFLFSEKCPTFTDALKAAIQLAWQKPYDERDLDGPLYGYDYDELNEIVIKVLLTRIKNGHKKYNRKKPVRPVSIQSAWSKLVKHRDGNKCINCGSDQNLQAHHIKHYKDDNNNWDVSNGITLCFQCHQKEHH